MHPILTHLLHLLHNSLEDNEHLVLSPFERNPEVWKQLWRVLERSDLVVQIVDSRDPLLFRSPDLEKYVDEFPEHKLSLMLMNKADLLSEKQREMWAAYFKKLGIRVLFFSARVEMLKIEKELADEQEEIARQMEMLNPYRRDDDESAEEDEEDGEDDEETEATTAKGVFDEERLKKLLHGQSADGDEEEVDDLSRLAANRSANKSVYSAAPKATAKVAIVEEESEKERRKKDLAADIAASLAKKEFDAHTIQDVDTSLEAVSGKIFTRTELFDYFYHYVRRELGPKEKVTVGMVGYPNVGKSSTVNVLAEKKKVAVSATPGKTKHFQTLQIHDNITLCDCPGLVFPTFMSSKAEMFCNGLLRIAEMRECIGPTSIVTSMMPRREFEYVYGIHLPKTIDPTSVIAGNDGKVYAPKAKLTPQQLLGTYADLRGFYITAGKPDHFKAARLVLNDFVDGKLLFCRAPPDAVQKDFNKLTKYNNPDIRKVEEDAPIRPNNRHGPSKHAPVRSADSDDEDDEDGDEPQELSPEDLMNLNDPEEMSRFNGKPIQQQAKPKHARINRKQERRRLKAGQANEGRLERGIHVDFKPGAARDQRALPTTVKLTPGRRAPGHDPSSTAAGRSFVAQTAKK